VDGGTIRWMSRAARSLRTGCVGVVVCALVLGIATNGAAAFSLKEDPFVQQAGPLGSSEVKELAEQGYSVALSANGDTAIVGGPDYNQKHLGEVFRGAAWVYTRTGSVWAQQAKLVGSESSGNAQQGHSVAISANGDTVIVGGPEDTGEHEEYDGAAWVFVREGTTWHKQQKLVATTGATDQGEQGSSVALSADGNTALVGAMDNEYNKTTTNAPGAAFVFTRSGSTWSQQGGKLEGNHSGELVQEGTSVALSGDGKTALIGGPRAEGEKGEREAGAAWVFIWNGGEWQEQAKLPQGSGSGLKTGQGQSVALSGDGNTALVGGPNYDTNVGATWVYVRSGSSWSQQAELQGEDASTEPQEGHSVSLSEDGNTALVGGYHDDTSVGASWAFERSGTSWDEQEKLAGTGSSGFETQGSAVALSADGSTALIGAAGDNGEVGAAWVFARAPEPEPETNQEPGPKQEPNPNPNPNNPNNGSNASTNTGTASSTGNSPSIGSTGTAVADLTPGRLTNAEREEKLATALGLPSAKACYSKRSLKIHIQQPPGYPKVVSAEVYLNGKKERTLSKKDLVNQVVLTRLPDGTFTIKIVAKTTNGTTITGTRTYHTCRTKPMHHHRGLRL
jgi:hypothetical protein